GIPSLISESEVASILDELLADLEDEIPQTGFSQADILSKSLAKGMAVKNGTSLNNLEQQNIVNRLFACKESALTPHNKPIFITLNVGDLDKKFN
ncbi:MAG TPA: DNA mismatch repair protein MutL, partial [Salinimicrobium sp.]|nr:DNA mismatch repair protein MutL [Salinimicrobium sp.]